MKTRTTPHSPAVNIPGAVEASLASDTNKRTEPAEVTTVAIVEDNAGLRRSLERLVSRAPGFRCLGAWPDGESALAELRSLEPKVVLMDINLPGISGIECTAALKRLRPGAQVIMVTVYEDTDSIFRALKAGACGYLLKRATSAEILEAIVEARQGGAPMTSEIARRVVEAFREPQPAPENHAELSSREQDILKLLSQGFSNKEIAAKLEIAYQTVKVHLKHIYEKLHVRSRTEALIKFMADRGPAGPIVGRAGESKPDGQ